MLRVARQEDVNWRQVAHERVKQQAMMVTAILGTVTAQISHVCHNDLPVTISIL
jgi:hypothetical protein